MKFKLLLFIIGLFTFGNGFSQVGRLALSPLQTIKQSIAKTDIEITYSRPAKRGRTIFGDLVPYDQRWRTGANRNTKITFSEEVIIGTTKLKKGSYAIFTKPNPGDWEVYFYTDTDNWNVPEDWDTQKIAAQLKIPSKRLEKSVSFFTISIDEVSNDQFQLSIFWDQTAVSIPISLTTEEQMAEDIKDALDGPDADDYFLAAQYRLESDKGFDQALKWINRAIELCSVPAWWDYRIKCLAMLEMGQSTEVKPFAQKRYELAQKHGSAYGIRELKAILNRCN